MMKIANWLCYAASGLLILIFANTAQGNPVPSLLNGDFDLCEIKGVACEWVFEGDGMPVNQDGYQGVANLPDGSSATIQQVVPFCSPGTSFRATVQISQAIKPGILLEIGLDPSVGKQPEQAIWQTATATGALSVDCIALGANMMVLLRVRNLGKSPANAYFDSISFSPVGIIREPAIYEDIQDQNLRQLAQKELEDARALLSKGEFFKARQAFESIMQKPEGELPRSVAADTLIRIQQTMHADDYLVRREAPEKQADMIGIPILRKVREKYPDQNESCALATCRMGEYYLNRQHLPMAKELLENTIRDYDGTDGAGWAKSYLVAQRMWSGDVADSSRLFEEICKDLKEGRATVKQKAWAELFFEGERISGGDPTFKQDRLESFREKQWTTYKDTFPEIAIRAKVKNAHDRMTSGRVYQGIDDMHEMMETFPKEMYWTIPGRIFLAYNLHRHGTQQKHDDEAFRILNEIENSDEAPDEYKDLAHTKKLEFSRPPAIPREEPVFGVNILENYHFDNPPVEGQIYWAWRLADRNCQPPNWFQVDWYEGVPFSGLGKVTPAWNSVNCGTKDTDLHSCLVANPAVVAPSVEITSKAWVAVDAWDGGMVSNAAFEITVEYMDCFYKPLGVSSTGSITYKGKPKEWIPISLDGITPNETRFAVFRIGFHVNAKGQHAVAISHAIMEEGEK